MDKQDAIIYIAWTYLIKEEDVNWEKKFYAKQVLDNEVWEELLYWRSEVKGQPMNKITSVDDVKKMLM